MRARKLIRSIELSDLKLLAAIAKVETNDNLKSDFEEMAAYILPCDHIANKKGNSNKNRKHRVFDASVESIVGGRDQQTKLDLRFYDHKEYKTLSNEDTSVLREWRLSNPKEFGQSKKRTLDALTGRNGNQHKHQKRNNFNNDIKAQIQSVTDIPFKAKLKEIDGDDAKKVSFKVDEANDEAWAEETVKKINNKKGSMSAATMEEMIKRSSICTTNH